jgi:catechol 2,3-dioxygenase-like lactoylglutathione lyase family enzyme
MKKAVFKPGENIAIKVPSDEFKKTVEFYRDVIGLTVLKTTEDGSVAFGFGNKKLWVDRAPTLSRAEIWLELCTADAAAAANQLARNGVVRRDEIEPLPSDMKAFWIKSPSGIIHLVSQGE